jgi:RNA polymerase sigma factor (TIGR02999 family)
MNKPGDITRLLADFARGDSDATEKLATLVYGQLRQLAAAQLRHERPGHSLQPTLLVHEAFLSLMDGKRPSIRNRSYFFALAARCMRRFLVDHARKKKAAKRGGGLETVVLNEELVLDEKLAYSSDQSHQLLALDKALRRLEKLDERQARIVEMRFFAGMTTQETAKVVGIGVTTVKKEWDLAKAWLRRELEP